MAFRIGPPPTVPARFNKPAKQSLTVDGELFDDLLPASYTPAKSEAMVHFPVLSFKMAGEHDLVRHKYWGVDGERIESTGRSALEFELVIPFFNGIYPAKGEAWQAGTLYPDGFNNFFRAFFNESSGYLVHPEIGQVFVRPASFETTHDANTRDGVQVTCKFIESREDHEDTGLVGENTSPITQATVAATDLEATRTNLVDLVPPGEFNDFTFDDFVGVAIGATDRVTQTVNLLAAKPGQIVNRVKLLEQSLGRLKDSERALAWKMKSAGERLEDAARTIMKGGATRTTIRDGRVRTEPVKETRLSPTKKPGRAIKSIVTPTAMTVSSILALIRQRGFEVFRTELQELNAVLMREPSVPAGTVIRFYAGT